MTTLEIPGTPLRHECNAICADGEHAHVVYTLPQRGADEIIRGLSRPNLVILSASPATEAPPPGHMVTAGATVRTWGNGRPPAPEVAATYRPWLVRFRLSAAPARPKANEP